MSGDISCREIEGDRMNSNGEDMGMGIHMELLWDTSMEQPYEFRI